MRNLKKSKMNYVHKPVTTNNKTNDDQKLFQDCLQEFMEK